jgi:hypothetical protein
MIFWCFVTSAASAEPSLDPSSDPLTVELLTMDPGEHPFFKFGHNAIRIRDARKGTDVVYNYGTFSFDSPTLPRDFFKGRLRYWLSRESMTTTLAHYAGENHDLVAQCLSLLPAQKTRAQASAGFQPAPGAPRVQVRLLLRQLFDAFARRARSSDGRTAARGIAAAGNTIAARPLP